MGEEGFSELCGRELTEAKEFAERQTFRSDEFIDVRDLQMQVKQLHVAAKLAAGGEEFFLPMEFGEETGKLHLRLEHVEGEAGRVSVELDTPSGRTRAEFRLQEGKISATLWGHGSSEVMKLSRAADIMNGELGEALGLQMDGTPIIVDLERAGDGRSAGPGVRNRMERVVRGMELRDNPAKQIRTISSEDLLRVAKIWIGAVSQKEVDYENQL